MVTPINTDSSYYNRYWNMNPAWSFWKGDGNNVKSTEYPTTKEQLSGNVNFNGGIYGAPKITQAEPVQGTNWTQQAIAAVSRVKGEITPNLATSDTYYTNGGGYDRFNRSWTG